MTKTEFVKAVGFTTKTVDLIDDIEDVGLAADANGVTFVEAAAGQSAYVAVLHRGYVIYLEDYSCAASVSTDTTLGVTNDTIRALGKKLIDSMAEAGDDDAETEIKTLVYDDKIDDVVELKMAAYYYRKAQAWLVSDEAKGIYDQMIESAETGGCTQDESMGMSLREMGDRVSDELLELTFED